MSERTTSLYLAYNERLKPWRTETVILLCKQMRETRDYSACPILADALQEADCDHQELLDELRDGTRDNIHKERLVAMVFSEEALKSSLWMVNLCQRIRIDGGDDFMAIIEPKYYDDVMSDCHKVVDGKISEGELIDDFGTSIFYEVPRLDFWMHFETITGRNSKIDWTEIEWQESEDDDDYWHCPNC